MLPILYQSHDLILYSYPLFMGLGWGVGYQVFFSRADIPKKYGLILFWGIFVSAWIGSKIFFYLTSAATDSKILAEASFWTGGGFVFYGGLIFVLLFLTLYKILKLPLTFQTLWSILPALTLGHAIGRIGCLLAGCCYGAVTDWWWGINLHGAHRHPTQILETAGLLALSFCLLKMKVGAKSFAVYFLGYGMLRFMIELLRGDEIRGHWGPMSPSQWISLAMMAMGLLLIFLRKFNALDKLKVK